MHLIITQKENFQRKSWVLQELFESKDKKPSFKDTEVLKGFEFGWVCIKFKKWLCNLHHSMVLTVSRMLVQAFGAEFQLQQFYSVCLKYFSWSERLWWIVQTVATEKCAQANAGCSHNNISSKKNWWTKEDGMQNKCRQFCTFSFLNQCRSLGLHRFIATERLT